MSSKQTVAVRRVRFEYPPDMPVVWTPSRPEFSCAANSVSMMMPTIEPYFVRSIRAAIDDLDGPLRERTEAYIGQESQHHRHHRRFNQLLIERHRSIGRLDRLIGRTYRWVERRGTRRFNIGFAAASETMAYAAARWAANHRRELFHGADDVASTLFLWHLAEEVEHKSVAHDLYWSRNRGPMARAVHAGATAVSLLSLMVFVAIGTTVMLWAARRLHHPVAWLRLTRWGIGFAFELLTNLALSMLPNHHPTDFADPAWYEVWLQEYDASDGTLPVWNRPEDALNPDSLTEETAVDLGRTAPPDGGRLDVAPLSSMR